MSSDLLGIELMSLHPRPRSSGGRFMVAVICTVTTLFHSADGFSILVKKVTTAPRVVLDSLSLQHIEPSSDARRWFDNAAASSLVARSSSATNDAIHDKLFIPAIVSMGVVVIICIICCYQLIVRREVEYPMRAGGFNQPPILSSQYAVQGQGNGYRSRPSSRALSKATRSPVPSTVIPSSPSAKSDTMGFHQYLQQKRFQQQLEQQQEQDPYHQYMMVHNDQNPQQHHQHTPSSVATPIVHPRSRGQGVQPRPPHGVQRYSIRGIGLNPARTSDISQHAQPSIPNVTAQQATTHQIPMSVRGQQEQNSKQQQQQRPESGRLPQTPSDVLSYMTPPEARQPPLPQDQDYFTPPPIGTGTPSQTRSSTHGITAHSESYTPDPLTTNLAHPNGARGYTNLPPGYSGI